MQRWLLGSLLGSALALLLEPLSALAQATVTVEPSEGPPGTAMRITGAGFEPSGVYKFQVLDSAGQTVYEETYVARPDGSLSERVESEPSDPPGQYTLRIMNAQNVPVASATTRLIATRLIEPRAPAVGVQTDAPAPATLPRAGDPGSVAPVLTGLGAALAGAGYALRRRGER